MTALIEDLKQASAGHAAVHGPDAPNLFQRALDEITHLRKLEEAVRSLDSGFPTFDYSVQGRTRTLEEQSRDRLQAAKEMLGMVRKWVALP